MKSISTGKIVFALFLAGRLLSLAPGQAHAQGSSSSAPVVTTVPFTDPLAKVTVSATEMEQGATTTATNGSGKIGAPVKPGFSTATLLHQLIVDETANGSYNPNSLPTTGAKLDYNTVTGDFEIDNSTNGMLADVSADGIFTLGTNGANVVEDGSFGTNGLGSGPPYNQTNFFLGILTYASPSGNTTTPQSWTVTGLAAIASKATNPKPTGSASTIGNYTLSGSVTFSGGTGEGTITPTSGPNNGVSTPVILSGFTITTSTASKPENINSGGP